MDPEIGHSREWYVFSRLLLRRCRKSAGLRTRLSDFERPPKRETCISPTSSWHGLCISLIMAVLLSACATRLPPLPANAIYARPVGVTPPESAAPKDPHNVLILSGGGAYGAYGAGFLTGWTERGNRPKFDVVTGVSTGSIIATCAFLGEEFDPLLKKLYTTFRTDQLLHVRFLPTAIFGESLLTSKPMKGLLEDVISDDMIDAVAIEHAKGRRLYAGTTNLDTRQFTVWDLGAIACSPQNERYELFRKVVLASASIPIAFEPVYFELEINGELHSQMHVDGGVVGPIFLFDWMLAPRPATGSNGSVYAILNLPYGEGNYEPVKPDLPGIANATFATLMEALNVSRLKEARSLSKDCGYDFRYAAVPATFAEDNNPLRFETEYLEKLFTKGLEDASEHRPWLEEPEALPGAPELESVQ